jgi:hypothetical protein
VQADLLRISNCRPNSMPLSQTSACKKPPTHPCLRLKLTASVTCAAYFKKEALKKPAKTVVSDICLFPSTTKIDIPSSLYSIARSSKVILPTILSASKVGSDPGGSTNNAVASTWNNMAGKARMSELRPEGP